METGSRAGRRYRGRRRDGSPDRDMLLRAAGRAAFFPLLLVYLELALHIALGMDLRYCVIYLLFALSMGCLLSALTMPFKRTVNRVLVKVLAVAVSLLYIVEIIAKKILQNFYSFSSLGMAAGNHLTDYTQVIVSMVARNIPLILVMLLPAILVILFGNSVLRFPRTDIRFAGVMAAGMALFHLLGLGAVHLPWGGDLTPAQLYRVDTNLDDQVEQLGLVTMLRLDVKHQIVPAGTLLDDDFTGLPVAPTSDPVGPEASQSQDPSASATPVKRHPGDRHLPQRDGRGSGGGDHRYGQRGHPVAGQLFQQRHPHQQERIYRHVRGVQRDPLRAGGLLGLCPGPGAHAHPLEDVP